MGDERPMGMDENNGCFAGCGAIIVLVGAAIIAMEGFYSGAVEYNATGTTMAENEGTLILFGFAIILIGVAIAMARKSRIT